MNQQLTVNGFFEVVRANPATSGRLILVCRDGRLFGADPKGRVYLGKLLPQQKHAVSRSFLKGTYEIPLKRRSPQRSSRQRRSVGVPITGEIDPLARTQNATIHVGDRKIEIQITYLGPLPP